MKGRGKLFLTKDIYNLKASDDLFVKAIKANIVFHMQKCLEYKDILNSFGFDLNEINNIEDLYKIPPLPTSYLKNHHLLSKKHDKLLIKTTSSGTSGTKTLSGFDVSSGLCGLSMVLKVFRYHKLISFKRTNYIILGYQPSITNQTAMAKSLKGILVFAPPKKVEYALKLNNNEYCVDVEGLIKAILEFSQEKNPVRIIGFPAYLKVFIDELKQRKIKLDLPKGSKIMLGGGWKNIIDQQISKTKLFELANEVFNIEKNNFKDHFSTAEHPINYIACEYGHFHVPVFSRVIIRDVKTLKPVANGVPGILNLVSPLLSSAPYNSILTDDIAILKNGNECSCTNSSPYFEVIGRVGLDSVKTCSQLASEYLKNV